MEQLFIFSNAFPYIVIFYFQKWWTLAVIKLGIIQLLMICSIQFHPNKIRNCHGDGVIALFIWNAYLVNFIQCILFVLRKLPITTVCCEMLDLNRFSIDLRLVSSCRGGLCVCNSGQTNFIMPSEHELW